MFAIEAVDIRKEFSGFVAVSDTSFKVERGEYFGLLGPNGAGKTTLVRMLTTLLLPTAGTAVVAGHDVRKNPDGVRRSIGVVPQFFTSDPKLTAKENLEFCARLYGVRGSRRRQLIEELLSWLDLTEWRNSLVGTFSGGMRRRLDIARSLVHEPQILFLDEPSTGLDPASRLLMWEMLRSLKSRGSLTVFLTTHYMEEADQLCNRIAILDHGKLIALDSAVNLKAHLPKSQSIDVSFDSGPQAWKGVVEGLPGVEGVQEVDGLCRISSRDRMVTLKALLKAATECPLKVTSVSLKENTMEDVFIHYTGRDTRDAAGKYRREIGHLYRK